MSNIGIAAMVWGVIQACSSYGASEVIKFYGIPWFAVTHWCSSFIDHLHINDAYIPAQSL
jgi:omega-6 fatty acid desaturase (delta-12 desaturase)